MCRIQNYHNYRQFPISKKYCNCLGLHLKELKQYLDHCLNMFTRHDYTTMTLIGHGL